MNGSLEDSLGLFIFEEDSSYEGLLDVEIKYTITSLGDLIYGYFLILMGLSKDPLRWE